MTRFGLAIAAAVCALPTAAHAFCGFYVSGSGDKMFADATQVVLMRDGTKTVLSMQNDYKGPLSDFAMVVPVPVVLHEKDVKTLPKAVFDHVESLGSPRLVEYWEQDPCFVERDYDKEEKLADAPSGRVYGAMPSPKKDSVRIEAKFDVAEYKILMSLGGDLVGGKIATGNFVLTRLHARYGKGDITDDLRFKAATPITGGREQMGANGALETGAIASAENYFQARYAVRHQWTGPIACKSPRRNIWGGPPDGTGNQVIAATKLAFAPRGALALPSVIKADIKELGVRRAAPSNGGTGGFAQPPGGSKAMGLGLGALGGLALIGLGLLVTRRRR